MLIEGKYCSLETDNPVKGQAVVDYMDWVYEQNKDTIQKEAFRIWMEGEYYHDYDGRDKCLRLRESKINLKGSQSDES